MGILVTDDHAPSAPSRSRVPDCPLCFDTGLHVAPSGRVESCPTIQAMSEHPALTLAGQQIERAVDRLRRAGQNPSSSDFELARTLAGFTSERPCGRYELIARHFSWKSGPENQRREVSKAIGVLHTDWFLPVGTRKNAPSGYWIIVDEPDFRSWVDRVKAESMTRLTTIHRLAKIHYPRFAGQLDLEFDQLKEAA